MRWRGSASPPQRGNWPAATGSSAGRTPSDNATSTASSTTPRLLVLPWITVPNLLSHLFKRLVRHDWHERYGITPALIETLVETPRFAGTAYKDSGWIHVGNTQGRKRQDTARRYRVQENTSGQNRFAKTGNASSATEPTAQLPRHGRTPTFGSSRGIPRDFTADPGRLCR